MNDAHFPTLVYEYTPTGKRKVERPKNRRKNKQPGIRKNKQNWLSPYRCCAADDDGFDDKIPLFANFVSILPLSNFWYKYFLQFSVLKHNHCCQFRVIESVLERYGSETVHLCVCVCVFYIWYALIFAFLGARRKDGIS